MYIEEEIKEGDLLRFKYDSIFGIGEFIGEVIKVIDNNTFEIDYPLGIITIKRTATIKPEIVNFQLPKL